MSWVAPDGTVYPDVTITDGVPARITIADFRRYFGAAFPKLLEEDYDDLLQDAINTVYAMFTGVGTLWDMQPVPVWFEKTQACYRLLCAWFVYDQYPDVSANDTSLNGVLLKRKSVDGVHLAFDTSLIRSTARGDYQDLLSGLRSNDFGRKALMMIQSAAKRALLRNRRYI